MRFLFAAAGNAGLHALLLPAFLISALLPSSVLAAESSVPGGPQAAHARHQAPRIDVAFVLDTTGSMTQLIQGSKVKIWSIAKEMLDAQVTPRLRMGLIGYRDRGDQYVTRVFDLLKAFVASPACHAS